MDIWGPLDLWTTVSHPHNRPGCKFAVPKLRIIPLLLTQMSRYKDIQLSVISHKVGPVTSKTPPRKGQPGAPPPERVTIGPYVMATHSFDNSPPLDILLIPGGLGNRVLEERGNTRMEEFVAARYPQLRYLLTVCTGSTTAASAGVLEGRRATSNKASWDFVVTHGKNVTWVPSARWVVDGNIWTSSGVAAGRYFLRCSFSLPAFILVQHW